MVEFVTVSTLELVLVTGVGVELSVHVMLKVYDPRGVVGVEVNDAEPAGTEVLGQRAVHVVSHAVVVESVPPDPLRIDRVHVIGTVSIDSPHRRANARPRLIRSDLFPELYISAILLSADVVRPITRFTLLLLVSPWKKTSEVIQVTEADELGFEVLVLVMVRLKAVF